MMTYLPLLEIFEKKYVDRVSTVSWHPARKHGFLMTVKKLEL